MATSKSNKKWSEIFNAPKQSSSSFADGDLTIERRHDSFSKFANSKREFSEQDFFGEPEHDRNPVSKALKKLKGKFRKRRA